MIKYGPIHVCLYEIFISLHHLLFGVANIGNYLGLDSTLAWDTQMKFQNKVKKHFLLCLLFRIFRSFASILRRRGPFFVKIV